MRYRSFQLQRAKVPRTLTPSYRKPNQTAPRLVRWRYTYVSAPMCVRLVRYRSFSASAGQEFRPERVIGRRIGWLRCVRPIRCRSSGFSHCIEDIILAVFQEIRPRVRRCVGGTHVSAPMCLSQPVQSAGNSSRESTLTPLNSGTEGIILVCCLSSPPTQEEARRRKFMGFANKEL